MTKDNNSQLINRRRMLQGLGVAGIASVAGCSGGGGGDGDGSGNQSGDGSGNQSGDGSGGGQSSQGGQLKMALVKSPLEFDPIVLNDVPSAQVSQNIFEGLYEYDESTGLVPALAAGEPEVNDDGTVYTVQIAEGATFQNGDPVTSEDVKYSFEAPVKEETENASEVNMVDTIDTPDEKTVTFNLSYPYGAFGETTLAWSIVPKAVREEDPDAFNNSKPVGSGPFEFDEWQEGQFARITRYDDYWGDLTPNLESVEFVPVEESTTRVTTLRNGENDIIEEIPPKLYSSVEQIQDAEIQEVPGIGYFYMAFNCAEGPTADPKVREAVDYCFDMDQAVSNYVEPTGVRQYSPLPQSIVDDWGFDLGQWEQIPHGKDIEQAKQLFNEAGVSQDYSWRIIVPPDDKREQIGVTVSNGLQEAGFNAEVQRLDWGAFLEQYISGSEDDYNIYTLGWSGSPDPDAFTYYMFGATEDTLGVTDGTFYHDSSQRAKEATEKFVQAREINDQEQRKQLYSEGITTVLEDRAHLPAYNLKNSYGVKNYVKDFAEHPVDSFHLASSHNNTSINKQ
ncbi:ABC transporter substrate-binding protein [Haloprofundus salilacus]|uniref:ABC transporter substrate-binding protein n=1 Tax=Haloprofundus salilacus TaxID=2876190 RepID=UPI001CC8F045|nr:ABC transporter substrate-binding protein [Haloprofundus salilacus]